MKQFLLLLATVPFALAAQDHLVGYVISPDGVQIAYDVYGIAKPLGQAPIPPPPGQPVVVLVHGWSCDRTYWSKQIDALTKKYKVVTIDLAGHGGSGTGRSEYTMASFGGDVASVVDKLKLEKVVLVGHSMGGDVIPEAAKRLPGRVAGLIMVDTYKKLGPGRSAEEVAATVARMRDYFRSSVEDLVKSMFLSTSDPALVERIVADMSSAPPDIALSAIEHALTYSRRMPQTLVELKLPVIALNPDNSPTDLASMKKYGVEVMIMKGVGHFLLLEDPARFNGMLVEAVGRVGK